MIIDHAKTTLSENFIKDLHLTLKNGTSDSRKEWFVVGDYKKVPNEVGGMNTALPEEVPGKMKELLKEYNAKAVFVDKNNKVYVSDGVEFTLTAKDYKILNL